MSFYRQQATIRKMHPGTLGGQSRVATPVSPVPLQSPQVLAAVAEPVCWSHFGSGETESAYTMSPDGTLVYGGISTNYNIYSFDNIGWSFVDTVTLQDIHGVFAPDPADQDWNFSGGYYQGSVVHPGSGLMYGFDSILELDNGSAVPGAVFHGALMRWDPSDGSNFEVVYHWSEDAGSTSTSATVWWHPQYPGLIWIIKEFDGVVDVQTYDTSTDTMNAPVGGLADIWSGVFVDLQGFSIFEYNDGIVWVLRSLDVSDEYRICNYHLPSSTLSTLDFDTASATDFDGYPFGIDYSGRLLFTATDGQIDGYRDLGATIGDLITYSDCDVFVYTDEYGTFYTTMFYWFAPADRSVIYSTDNGFAVFSQTP